MIESSIVAVVLLDVYCALIEPAPESMPFVSDVPQATSTMSASDKAPDETIGDMIVVFLTFALISLRNVLMDAAPVAPTPFSPSDSEMAMASPICLVASLFDAFIS